jgi:large subunit ribosomal protein L4
VVFGPVPRRYDHALPKKVRRAALRSAVSLRREEGSLFVVDDLPLEQFRTREVVQMLEGLGLGGESVLIVTDGARPHLEASARNLPRVDVIRAAGLNVYDVLRRDKLLLTKDAVDAVQRRLGASPEEPS